jgi:hypothetical protein
MDISSLTKVPRACACWRLACELDRALDILNARPKVKLTEENFCALFVPTAGGLSAIPGKLYHELRRHCGRLENFAFWVTHLPPRTAADTECVRCRTLPLDRNHFHAVSSPLSVGGAMALCRDCELELGLNLPPYWPRCDECARPFPTTTAGEAALGRWVSPIDDGEPLCGNCWLAQRYHGDHTAMIEHTLATDTLQLAQGAVALDFRRMRFGTDILDQACTCFGAARAY